MLSEPYVCISVISNCDSSWSVGSGWGFRRNCICVGRLYFKPVCLWRATLYVSKLVYCSYLVLEIAITCQQERSWDSKTYRQTHIHRHTHTDTRRCEHTHMHKDTDIHKHAHTHAHTHVPAKTKAEVIMFRSYKQESYICNLSECNFKNTNCMYIIYSSGNRSHLSWSVAVSKPKSAAGHMNWASIWPQHCRLYSMNTLKWKF